MIVNDKAIYRSAADGLYHVGEAAFETVDQAAWFAWTGQTKTIAEVRSIMAKLDTAKAVVGQVQNLAQPMDAAPDTFQEYWDVVNAEDAFTDEELTLIGITAAQLTACIATIEAFNTLMVAQHATVNVMRRVDLS